MPKIRRPPENSTRVSARFRLRVGLYELTDREAVGGFGIEVFLEPRAILE